MQVLRQLPANEHPELLVGTDHLDDAGVFRIDERTALVQTLDFFPPLVDDPFIFGQIAAANALSDVYAMGGTPLTAMNIVAFPDKDLSAQILIDILRGGHERVQAAGAVIVGGHSIRDADVKYGLSVTGRVDPQHIVTNASARPGDRVVVTKPIGSGILTTAARQQLITQAELTEVLQVMTHLNRSGAQAMCEVGANAATDITGFGLIGHAFEMAEASAVTLRIEAAAVPLMHHTLKLARDGALTRAHKGTKQHVGEQLVVHNVDPVLVNVLCDAQTSGGLLICVPEHRTADLVAALERHEACCWKDIGTVIPRKGHAVELV